MKKIPTINTSDLFLVALLEIEGHKWSKTKKSGEGRVTFIYEHPSSEVILTQQNYYSGYSLVNALSLANNVKNLRSLIRDL